MYYTDFALAEGVGSSFFDEDQEEAEQILKKARRRNRKHGNVIVLN